jgi:hypothetical protein
VLVFNPVRIQLAAPPLDEQERVFTAAVTAGPGVIETPEICKGE